MEAGSATFTRGVARETYPARFHLVAALDPRANGGGDHLRCLAAPLVDRMDMIVQLPLVPEAERSSAPAGEASAAVAHRVNLARTRQRARRDAGAAALGGDTGLLPDARELVSEATERLGLPASGLARALRLARTVADLTGAPLVRRVDVEEALAYRHRSWSRA